MFHQRNRQASDLQSGVYSGTLSWQGTGWIGLLYTEKWQAAAERVLNH